MNLGQALIMILCSVCVYLTFMLHEYKNKNASLDTELYDMKALESTLAEELRIANAKAKMPEPVLIGLSGLSTDHRRPYCVWCWVSTDTDGKTSLTPAQSVARAISMDFFDANGWTLLYSNKWNRVDGVDDQIVFLGNIIHINTPIDNDAAEEMCLSFGKARSNNRHPKPT